ncbi:MAG: hypothetical protein AAB613_01885 [Patescibacteria group bacterium]
MIARTFVIASIAGLLVACGGGGTNAGTGFIPTKFWFGFEAWNPNTHRNDIYLARSNGAEDRVLNNADLVGAEQPSFSLDGSLLAYYKLLGNNKAGIYVMNVDNGNATKIAEFEADQSTIFAWPIAWSRDHGRLIYIDPRGKAFVINVDGSNPLQLTPATFGVYDRSARFSPDGSKVVFERKDNEIWMSDSDGGNQVKIAGSPERDYLAPDWSPDGTRLVCVRYADLKVELFTMNPDGSNETKLPVTGRTRDINWPYWSPDGSMVVFEENENGEERTLVVVEVATGKIFRWPTDKDRHNTSWIDRP